MSRLTPFPAANWYVVHTNPRQEDRAECNLRAWGVETFNPKLKEYQYRPYNAESIYVVKPLFPSYIFARFDVEYMYHKVRYTRGVHTVISHGQFPTVVDDELVELIRSRVGEDGLIRIGDDLSPGDEVVIKDGPFRALTGIFERRMKGSDRVVILLKTISYQAHIVIGEQMLKKAAK